MGNRQPLIKPNECCKLHQLYLMVPSEIIERGVLFFVTEGVMGPDSKLSLVITEQASIPKSVELVLTGVLDKDFYKL